MRWLDGFHDEHAALEHMLIKLEGNLKDIEQDTAGVNIIWELKETVDIINMVIIPHFKKEEEDIYPEALRLCGDKSFMMGLYKEHELLHSAFAEFIASLGEKNLALQIQRGDKLGRIIAKSKFSHLDEMPKNLERPPEKKPLPIDKETLLKSGYKIIQLLRQHIQKEETQLCEIMRKKVKLTPSTDFFEKT